jgi:hypothetical protein
MRPRDLSTLDTTLQALNSGQQYESPGWILADGIEQVVAHWFTAGGGTQVVTATLRESIDGVSEDSTQALGPAAAQGPASPNLVRVRTPWIKFRVAVSVANATTLRACLKAS